MLLPKFNMPCSMSWLKQAFRRLELQRRTVDPPELHVRMLIKVGSNFGMLDVFAIVLALYSFHDNAFSNIESLENFRLFKGLQSCMEVVAG